MKSIDFKNITLGGFWGERQKTNREVTVYNVYKRFKDTGRFDAFKCDYKEGDPKKPHIFWDSDVAKWIESVAYITEKNPDKRLEKIVDETVELIKKNQSDDGYFNIYYTAVEPGKRFTNRMNHELYCAGHLMEAAVAYCKATGKRELLDCMEKYADCIERVFVKEDSAAFNTPGHEEIELALVKMAEFTGKEKYLDLARYFVNTRGTSEKDESSPYFISQAYSQSHMPVRDMREAVGHCVRAVYLYSAMADLARIDGDKELFDACDALFNDVVNKKMYITGGLGGSLIGEAFSEPYDLPNELAYSETCAAIGFALFCRRMSLLKPSSKYDNAAERAIYNALIAGCSSDGKSFFYEDPLEINLKERKMISEHRCSEQHLPITERVEVFDCSCCPPNFTRFTASFGDFLYSQDENTLYIHHYCDSKAEFDGVSITQSTAYPADGNVTFTLSGLRGKKAALRIPDWSRNTKFLYNSKKAAPEIKDGFAYFDITEDNCTINVLFDMTPRLITADPRLENSFGRAALCYGPLVYCLEGIDNGSPLRSLAVSSELNAEIIKDGAPRVPVIEADGFRYESSSELYFEYPQKKTPVRLRFIPYFAFANRGETDMLVFLRVADK